MNKKKIKESINEFFSTVNNLKNEGLFRSDKYLGDIGERICENLYSLNLCESGRQVGYDGTSENGSKYQIKFHNSPKRTNITLGNPKKYDYILIVIGPESKMKRSKENRFEIYKFTSKTVEKNHKKSETYSCGIKALPKKPDKILNL